MSEDVKHGTKTECLSSGISAANMATSSSHLRTRRHATGRSRPSVAPPDSPAVAGSRDVSLDSPRHGRAGTIRPTVLGLWTQASTLGRQRARKHPGRSAGGVPVWIGRTWSGRAIGRGRPVRASSRECPMRPATPSRRGCGGTGLRHQLGRPSPGLLATLRARAQCRTPGRLTTSVDSADVKRQSITARARARARRLSMSSSRAPLCSITASPGRSEYDIIMTI